MTPHEIHDVVRINDTHVLEISLQLDSNGNHHLQLEIKTPSIKTSKQETVFTLDLNPETALILGSKLQFLAQLPQFLTTLESRKPVKIADKSQELQHPTIKEQAEKMVFILVPTNKNVISIVKMLLRKFKGKTVSIMDLQRLLKQDLSARGFKEEEFEDALGYLVLMNIIHPEAKESQSGFKYWVFTFPRDDLTAFRWNDYKQSLMQFLNDVKQYIKDKQPKSAKDLVKLQKLASKVKILSPSNNIHEELLGKDFRIEVASQPQFSIKFVTWSSDPLTWQVAHLMAWHFCGRQIIFSKLRESMEKRYDLPLVVIEKALETLIDNKIVTVEERQAKAGHHYKLYLFPDELVILFDDSIDLMQQVTLLEQTIKKIETKNA